ncbi:uncharacterized protein LOC129587568 [Paramacrobiotus metropolitanus]|uniref:uncharacterized protein LOC129587568 n=1 Tax=Paramacrobiotus metropolitanus TaxID=2943436 RepID=UPI002445D22F|nr:uncharacterized protein LOC129587568 [Paramacrobiotus metropolitanus]
MASADQTAPPLDLDDLLQQTLADFDKPDLLPSEKSLNNPSAPGASHPTPSAKSPHPPTAHPPPLADDDEKFFRETSQEINEILTSIDQEDPALAQQLRTLTEFANSVHNPDEQTAMYNFTQFASLFKETLQTISTHTGLQSDELVDDDLTDIMENLDKLAIGEESGAGATEGIPDVVQSMLSKSVMLSSLQKCHEEYAPWIAEKRGTLAPKELEGCEAQLAQVGALIAEYEKAEEPCYARIVEMMARLQELGEFPEELMAKVNTKAFVGGTEGKRDERPELDVPDCRTS